MAKHTLRLPSSNSSQLKAPTLYCRSWRCGRCGCFFLLLMRFSFVGGSESSLTRRTEVSMFSLSICRLHSMLSRELSLSPGTCFYSRRHIEVLFDLLVFLLMSPFSCVQVRWRAVRGRRRGLIHRLSLESVHRRSARRLQPPLAFLLCPASSPALHQVRGFTQKKSRDKIRFF